MRGFKSMASATISLEGIELVHMICKGQMEITDVEGRNPSFARQFDSLAA
jgi:putative transposase